MPGSPPKYRLFISDETGKMPKDQNGFWVELAALWPTRMPDKHGNEKYSGKTGRGDQFVMLVENVVKKREAPEVKLVVPDPDDVPF
jgi:hypothetical protein